MWLFLYWVNFVWIYYKTTLADTLPIDLSHVQMFCSLFYFFVHIQSTCRLWYSIFCVIYPWINPWNILKIKCPFCYYMTLYIWCVEWNVAEWRSYLDIQFVQTHIARVIIWDSYMCCITIRVVRCIRCKRECKKIII